MNEWRSLRVKCHTISILQNLFYFYYYSYFVVKIVSDRNITSFFQKMIICFHGVQYVQKHFFFFFFGLSKSALSFMNAVKWRPVRGSASLFFFAQKFY